MLTSGALGTSPGVFEHRGIRVERVTHESGLAPWAEAWDELAMLAPQRRARLSYAWTASLLRHAGDTEAEVVRDFGLEPTGEAWSCLLASRGDELLGVMPVMGVRRQSLVGVRRRAAVAVHGPRETCGDLLVAPGPAGELALAALFSVAARTLPHPMWLELDQVCDTSPTLAAVRRGLPGARAIIEPVPPLSYIPVEGSFAEFFARLSKNSRKNLRRIRNKSERLDGLAFECVDGPLAWRELDRFVALEASGWKGRENSAIGSSSGTLAYYRSLTRELSARGWLELTFLSGAGRLLAGEINVRFGGVLLGLRCAYDEAFGDYAPGTLLLERSVQRAFETGVKELNAGSDHAWTRAWGMRQRRCWSVRLFPGSPRSLLLGYLPARLRSSLRRRSPAGPARPQG
jgi:hypothetical protein